MENQFDNKVLNPIPCGRFYFRFNCIYYFCSYEIEFALITSNNDVTGVRKYFTLKAFF